MFEFPIVMRSRAVLSCAVFSALMAVQVPALAGEAYATGFDSPPFSVGADTIRGTDGWVGQSSLIGKALSGTMSEAQHGVVGIGNAAYLGGNSARVSGVSYNWVQLRRPVNIDPVALDQEIATFSVVFGIKDSSAASSYRRDNFEFQIWNNSGQLLAGIQFDNSTIDSLTGLPQRSIYLSYWTGRGSTGFENTNTGYTFLPETLELLDFRINFRTNRWTVLLGDTPLFKDLAFYNGPNTRTLGFVMAQMEVRNTYPSSSDIYPGDNYMLFDDYKVRTDPVTVSLASSWTDTGAFKLVWNEEYGHQYRLQYSSDCANWLDFTPTIHTATATSDYSYTDTTTPRPAMRFFRVRRNNP
jgi:hypothetical protein